MCFYKHNDAVSVITQLYRNQCYTTICCYITQNAEMLMKRVRVAICSSISFFFFLHHQVRLLLRVPSVKHYTYECHFAWILSRKASFTSAQCQSIASKCSRVSTLKPKWEVTSTVHHCSRTFSQPEQSFKRYDLPCQVLGKTFN